MQSMWNLKMAGLMGSLHFFVLIYEELGRVLQIDWFLTNELFHQSKSKTKCTFPYSEH